MKAKPNLRSALLTTLLAILLPYLAAALAAGPDKVFVGFLTNPLDGATYLAKMYQGWSGAWVFRLPFTADPGQGAYLFLFYLFLGHLARWFGLPLMVVYHAARLLGAAALVYAVYALYERLFPERPDLFRLAFWLTLFGSGMGWLVIFSGYLPTDFWVAEAYPFLSMFANPHFPLGLALLLGVFVHLLRPASLRRDGLLLLAGLLLAIILPFAQVVALLVAGLWAGLTWLQERRLTWRPLVSLGLLGGPVLLYQFWVAQTDPVLAGWNAQNLTPSPPLWDLLLSFSPALLLALVGLAWLWKQPHPPALRLLLVWFVFGLALVYFPFALQRRFLLGFYIPVTALALFGLDGLRQRFPGRTRRLAAVVFALALPTNLLLLLVAGVGIIQRDPVLYLAKEEYQALHWIETNTPAHALVLASPEMGRFIPGFTGRRVLYGHPFETVNAGQEEAQVTAFFARNTHVQPADELLSARQVDYVIYGPRERALGGTLDLSALPLVFEAGPVQVFAVRGQGE